MIRKTNTSNKKQEKTFLLKDQIALFEKFAPNFNDISTTLAPQTLPAFSSHSQNNPPSSARRQTRTAPDSARPETSASTTNQTKAPEIIQKKVPQTARPGHGREFSTTPTMPDLGTFITQELEKEIAGKFNAKQAPMILHSNSHSQLFSASQLENLNQQEQQPPEKPQVPKLAMGAVKNHMFGDFAKGKDTAISSRVLRPFPGPDEFPGAVILTQNSAPATENSNSDQNSSLLQSKINQQTQQLQLQQQIVSARRNQQFQKKSAGNPFKHFSDDNDKEKEEKRQLIEKAKKKMHSTARKLILLPEGTDPYLKENAKSFVFKEFSNTQHPNPKLSISKNKFQANLQNFSGLDREVDSALHRLSPPRSPTSPTKMRNQDHNNSNIFNQKMPAIDNMNADMIKEMLERDRETEQMLEQQEQEKARSPITSNPSSPRRISSPVVMVTHRLKSPTGTGASSPADTPRLPNLVPSNNQVQQDFVVQEFYNQQKLQQQKQIIPPQQEKNPVIPPQKEQIPIIQPQKEQIPIIQPQKIQIPIIQPQKGQIPIIQPQKEQIPVVQPQKGQNPVIQPQKEQTPNIQPQKEQNLTKVEEKLVEKVEKREILQESKQIPTPKGIRQQEQTKYEMQKQILEQEKEETTSDSDSDVEEEVKKAKREARRKKKEEAKKENIQQILPNDQENEIFDILHNARQELEQEAVAAVRESQVLSNSRLSSASRRKTSPFKKPMTAGAFVDSSARRRKLQFADDPVILNQNNENNDKNNDNFTKTTIIPANNQPETNQTEDSSIPSENNQNLAFRRRQLKTASTAGRQKPLTSGEIDRESLKLNLKQLITAKPKENEPTASSRKTPTTIRDSSSAFSITERSKSSIEYVGMNSISISGADRMKKDVVFGFFENENNSENENLSEDSNNNSFDENINSAFPDDDEDAQFGSMAARLGMEGIMNDFNPLPVPTSAEEEQLMDQIIPEPIFQNLQNLEYQKAQKPRKPKKQPSRPIRTANTTKRTPRTPKKSNDEEKLGGFEVQSSFDEENDKIETQESPNDVVSTKNEEKPEESPLQEVEKSLPRKVVIVAKEEPIRLSSSRDPTTLESPSPNTTPPKRMPKHNRIRSSSSKDRQRNAEAKKNKQNPTEGNTIINVKINSPKNNQRMNPQNQETKDNNNTLQTTEENLKKRSKSSSPPPNLKSSLNFENNSISSAMGPTSNDVNLFNSTLETTSGITNLTAQTFNSNATAGTYKSQSIRTGTAPSEVNSSLTQNSANLLTLAQHQTLMEKKTHEMTKIFQNKIQNFYSRLTNEVKKEKHKYREKMEELQGEYERKNEEIRKKYLTEREDQANVQKLKQDNIEKATIIKNMERDTGILREKNQKLKNFKKRCQDLEDTLNSLSKQMENIQFSHEEELKAMNERIESLKRELDDERRRNKRMPGDMDSDVAEFRDFVSKFAAPSLRSVSPKKIELLQKSPPPPPKQLVYIEDDSVKNKTPQYIQHQFMERIVEIFEKKTITSTKDKVVKQDYSMYSANQKKALQEFEGNEDDNLDLAFDYHTKRVIFKLAQDCGLNLFKDVYL